MKIKCRLHGRKYVIYFRRPKNRKHEATCNYNNNTILISPKSKRPIECLIHECLHAMVPELHEYTVTECARDLNDVLIKMIRKIGKKMPKDIS
jgi:hypothetical protein